VHGNALTLFVVQAILIVALSRIVGLIARRLGQPMVIAEVAAGIMLGPSLLGWLAPHALATVFPASSMPMLNIMSQVGLIFFMFLIGLELDPKLLHGRGRTSVIISHSSIVVPFVLGSLLALYLYPILSKPREVPFTPFLQFMGADPSLYKPHNVPFTSFMLFMGVAMSITAFPVLARILSERRLMRTKIGAIAIACAAVDDVTAWCVLAFVVSIVRASGISSAIVTSICALLYIFFMIFVVRPFLARVGARSTNREGLNQNIVAVTFILLLLSSTATELIGIHALFGAFLFGAIMPREGGYAQALAEKLEDFVVVFMLPLFFAYSGLRTQINLLNSLDTWIYCGLITLAACVGKFGGSAIAARLTGLPWREAWAIGILMNTRGLMELIVLNIGLDLGVLSPALFTMMVLMALITTFMTTPLLSLFYAEHELDKALAESRVALPAKAFRLMLCVAHDRTGPAMAVLASALAGKDPKLSRVTALRLLPPPERTSTYLAEEARESRRMSAVTEKDGNALIPLLERSEQLGLIVQPLSFVSSSPAEDICHVAAVKEVDLVLLGWHKPLIHQSRLGGVVYDVMSQAHTDVGVLIDRGLSRVQRVLLPYNGSVHDQSAFRLARRLNSQLGAHITILHVVEPNRDSSAPGRGARDQFNSVFSDQLSGSSVVMKVVENHEPAKAALAEAANGYDLIVIGSGPEWGLEQRQYGLKAEELITNAATSLLIVRAYQRDVTAATPPAMVPPANPMPPAPPSGPSAPSQLPPSVDAAPQRV
jgi:Kef-type K+ transport system membrane component KefB/nucleotide-binding universal stress UspA family protein